MVTTASLRKRALCAATLLLCPCGAVIAQPPSPGAVGEPFKQELRLPTGELPPAAAPSAPPPTKAPTSDRRILVKQFRVTGNTVFSSEQLLAEIIGLQGKALTLQEIYGAADVLTSYYRERGYNLARVVVPAQRVSFGIIELQVIEGKLNAVVFEGNQSYDEAFLQPYVARLEPGSVVTLDALERELLLLNDLPGLTSRAVIRPGPVYGTSDLAIQSVEQRLQGRVSVNNYGREEVGEWRLEGEFIANNLSGRGDQLNLALTKAESGLLDYFSAAYSLPVNARGSRLGLEVAYIDYDVGADFAALGIDGENTDVHFTFSHPLRRSRRHNVLFGIGVGRNDTETRALGVSTSDRDITLLDVNLLMNWVHPDKSVSTLTGQFSTNFRSNPDGLRNNAQKGKLQLEASHLRAVAPKWSLFSRAVAVLSLDPLVDTERFSIGGQGSVRGFPAAEVRGDQGLQMTVEGRRRVRLGDMRGTFRVFGDVGKVYRKDPQPGEQGNESLSSVGLGLSLAPSRNTSIDIDYARPTNNHDASDGEDSGRWWLNLSARF